MSQDAVARLRPWTILPGLRGRCPQRARQRDCEDELTSQRCLPAIEL